MPGVVLLAAAIVVNWIEHRRHKPTICSTVRGHVPRPATVAGLAGLFAWLIAHLWRGYPPHPRRHPHGPE